MAVFFSDTTFELTTASGKVYSLKPGERVHTFTAKQTDKFIVYLYMVERLTADERAASDRLAAAKYATAEWTHQLDG